MATTAPASTAASTMGAADVITMSGVNNGMAISTS